MLGDVDVVAEYAALRDAAGVVDGRHQMVIAEGPDTIRFLNDLLSQEVAGCRPAGWRSRCSSGRRALACSPLAAAR